MEDASFEILKYLDANWGAISSSGQFRSFIDDAMLFVFSGYMLCIVTCNLLHNLR